MKAVYPPVCFTGLILAVFADLALPMMGQVAAPARKVEPTTAVASPLPVPPPITSGSEIPTEPSAMDLIIRSFFVDPYQFHEVVRPKLLLLAENSLDGAEVCRGLREWFAQLGVDMYQPGKSIFWHDDGRLLVRASSADVNTIEAAIIAMGKEYSGTPHLRLEMRVIKVAPDALEEGLRKLKLLSEAGTDSQADVAAGLLRRFATLGVNLSLPKTFRYDRSKGYVALCATCADLEIIEPELVRLLRPIGTLR